LLNENFQKLDTLGNPLPSSAININADLPFNGYNATELNSTEYENLTAPLGAGFLCAVYFSGGNFYINNGSGTPVQITAGNAVNAGAGNISGLPSTPAGAGVSYSNANGYAFVGAGGLKYAPLQSGGVQLFDGTSNSPANPISLLSPVALATAYALTLPPTQSPGGAWPGFGNTGIGAWYSPDGTTLELSGTSLRIKAGGVSTTQLSDGGVTASKIAGNVFYGVTSFGTNWAAVDPVSAWVDVTGTLHLRGSVSRSGGSATLALTLPSVLTSSFPLTNRGFALSQVSGGVGVTPCSAFVDTSGQLWIFNVVNNSTVYLDAIQFLAGQ
jgi:hypothetical protein